MSDEKENKGIHEAISTLLNAKLQYITKSNMKLDVATCVEIYCTIFDTIVEVMTNSDVLITNESMNYVAQCYYDGILVNGNQELDPEIFTQRAKLENISTKELALLCVMLKGTAFALPPLDEIKKRS